MVLLLFAIGSATFVAMVKGCLVLRRQARVTPRYDGNIILKSPLVPSISMIVPVLDSSSDSFSLARRLVELHFGKHEVVVVLDGPSEAALEAWTNEFRLCPSVRNPGAELPCAPIRGIYESSDPIRIVVVDKEAGGQADANNAGVNAAASPVIGLLDPYCEFGPGILLNLILPMLDDPDRTLAVCGMMPTAGQGPGLLGDAPKAPARFGWTARIGELEALRTWLARGAAYSGWNRLVPVPGASMLVKREVIVKIGGFRAGPLELFLHMHAAARTSKRRYRVAFVPEGVSYPRQPASIGDLRRQNLREEREMMSAVGTRKSIRRMRAIGVGIPAILGVRFFRPFIETLVYPLTVAGWFMGWVDLPLVGVVVISTVGMGMVVSMAALFLRELVELHGSDPTRLTRLFFATITENLGYRQVRNLWLVAGFFQTSAKKRG